MKTFVVDCPTIKILVRKEYLTQGQESGLEEAYLVAVKSTHNGPLHFTVHLSSGAIFSSLPISALVCSKFNKEINNGELLLNIPLEKSQPFSCLEGNIQVIEYSYFKNYRIKTKDFGYGYYLFTVEYAGLSGFSDDPEQFKTHNVVVLDSGDMVALPNNMLLAIDEHFVDEIEKFPNYKRNNNYYLAGS